MYMYLSLVFVITLIVVRSNNLNILQKYEIHFSEEKKKHHEKRIHAMFMYLRVADCAIYNLLQNTFSTIQLYIYICKYAS